MDCEKWPTLIEPLLARLNKIVYTDFPMPQPYPSLSRPSQPTPQPPSPTQLPPSTPQRNLPPVPPFPTSSNTTSTSLIPDSLPDNASHSTTELPALLSQIHSTALNTLRTNFSHRPPHTIQRLAELTLYPTKHYKTLPAWLRALDRVVSVSSSADIFPLSETPPVVNGVNGDGAGGILWANSDSTMGRREGNGTGGMYDSANLGSDESLGGALLTPIPWLRNGNGDTQDESEGSSGLLESTASGSSADPDADALDDTAGLGINAMIPERENGAVTQGELIATEQNAGVIPVTRSPGRAEEGLATSLVEDTEELPHARGPDVVGSVDIGRVDGRDMQIRIGDTPGEGEGQEGSDANDAQTVLQGGGTTTAEENGPASGLDAEDFEIVLKDVANGAEGSESDAMQVDSQSSTTQTQEMQQLGLEEQDGDIVLVDADGKSDDAEKD
jgi:hypothetical protein